MNIINSARNSVEDNLRKAVDKIRKQSPNYDGYSDIEQNIKKPQRSADLNNQSEEQKYVYSGIFIFILIIGLFVLLSAMIYLAARSVANGFSPYGRTNDGINYVYAPKYGSSKLIK